jgi:hypothetical protein
VGVGVGVYCVYGCVSDGYNHEQVQATPNPFLDINCLPFCYSRAVFMMYMCIHWPVCTVFSSLLPFPCIPPAPCLPPAHCPCLFPQGAQPASYVIMKPITVQHQPGEMLELSGLVLQLLEHYIGTKRARMGKVAA